MGSGVSWVELGGVFPGGSFRNIQEGSSGPAKGKGRENTFGGIYSGDNPWTRSSSAARELIRNAESQAMSRAC